MALTDNLVGYWTLDEASGTRNDAVGSAHLTDTNTVGSTTGKVSLCADVEFDNAEYLTVADPAALSLGDTDFTITAWVQLESKQAQEMFAVAKGDGDGFEYALQYNNLSDRFQWLLCAADGFAQIALPADTAGSPALATWYFLVGWHDASGDMLHFQVNDGFVEETPYSDGSYDSDAPFTIGGYPVFGLNWDGLIDEVGIWSRVLTTEERTTLYNGGAGLTYPFTVSAQPVTMLTFLQ